MKSLPPSQAFLLWIFTFLWILKVLQYVSDVPRLLHLRQFYRELISVNDDAFRTVTWQQITRQLTSLRESNPLTAETTSNRAYLGQQMRQRIEAHDIANRIMRRENYLIALFNKDVLDLTLSNKFFQSYSLLTRTLEWNLTLCILDYVFDESGDVRHLFVKDTHRSELSKG